MPGPAQTSRFPREALDEKLEEIKASPALAEHFDLAKEVDVQSDKAEVKLCACTECGRPVVVNQFYAPAIARCASCKGSASQARQGTVAVPQAGRTEPAKAANLADCLINDGFATATCPVGGEEHRMELKAVVHNENYGPSEFTGDVKNGIPQYRQVAQGETVMHQCLDCRATVHYSTTAQTQFRRMNEPRPSPVGAKGANQWLDILGAREKVEVVR